MPIGRSLSRRHRQDVINYRNSHISPLPTVHQHIATALLACDIALAFRRDRRTPGVSFNIILAATLLAGSFPHDVENTIDNGVLQASSRPCSCMSVHMRYCTQDPDRMSPQPGSQHGHHSTIEQAFSGATGTHDGSQSRARHLIKVPRQIAMSRRPLLVLFLAAPARSRPSNPRVHVAGKRRGRNSIDQAATSR